MLGGLKPWRLFLREVSLCRDVFTLVWRFVGLHCRVVWLGSAGELSTWYYFCTSFACCLSLVFYSVIVLLALIHSPVPLVCGRCCLCAVLVLELATSRFWVPECARCGLLGSTPCARNTTYGNVWLYESKPIQASDVVEFQCSSLLCNEWGISMEVSSLIWQSPRWCLFHKKRSSRWFPPFSHHCWATLSTFNTSTYLSRQRPSFRNNISNHFFNYFRVYHQRSTSNT